MSITTCACRAELYGTPSESPRHPLLVSLCLRRTELVAGAIFCSRSLVSVSKSAAFVDNTASGSGGALYCVTCDIKLNGVDFHSNTASFGGAVALVSSGSDPDQAGDGLPSKVINCTFESNAATDGGGFYSVAGFDTIKDSVFRGNFAGEQSILPFLPS